MESFQTNRHYAQQVYQAHPNYMTYKGDDWVCMTCGKAFKNSSGWETHLRKHTQQKPFMCCQCHASFASKGNLNRHMKVHTNVKDFVCPKCGKSFKYESSIIVHQRRHQKIYPFQCNMRNCLKKFTNQAHLQYHKRKFHSLNNKRLVQKQSEEEEPANVACDHRGCKKKFQSLKEMNIHHGRYSKSCAVSKQELKTKIKKTKLSIKKIRKENQLLQNFLKKHQIDYKSEIRAIKKDKAEMQNIDQTIRGYDTPPEFLQSQSTLNQTLVQEPQNGMSRNRNISGLVRRNQQRQALKYSNLNEESYAFDNIIGFDQDFRSDSLNI